MTHMMRNSNNNDEISCNDRRLRTIVKKGEAGRGVGDQGRGEGGKSRGEGE